MELSLCKCLLSLAGCIQLIFIGTVVCYDTTYYIEQDCRSGNLTIPLMDGGPMSAVHLKATIYASYSIGMECHINVTAPAFHRIVVSVLQIGFRMYPTGVCKDYIKIESIMCKNMFRLDEGHHFISANNSTQMFYYVSKDGLNNWTLSDYPGVKLTVTAVTENNKCPSSDDKDWFKCDNGYCIWSGLKCDANNNCGDLSDEKDCGSSTGNGSTVLIILGGLILLLMVIMCIATLLCSKNETVRRLSNRLRSRTLSYLPKFSR